MTNLRGCVLFGVYAKSAVCDAVAQHAECPAFVILTGETLDEALARGRDVAAVATQHRSSP